MLLRGDFEAFTAVDPAVDAVFGRPVPPDLVRARFGKTHGWRAFQRKTVKRWLSWIRRSSFSDSDRVFLSQVVYKSLGVDP